jgi:hypothetical protein
MMVHTLAQALIVAHIAEDYNHARFILDNTPTTLNGERNPDPRTPLKIGDEIIIPTPSSTTRILVDAHNVFRYQSFPLVPPRSKCTH